LLKWTTRWWSSMERAFAAPALAHGSTMDRGIFRVDVKIDVAIAIERPLTSNAQLDASMCFR
jgi:hypothetical protein